MGIFRLLKQWREKSDGTLSGPAVEADSADISGKTTTGALESDEATINGQLAEDARELLVYNSGVSTSLNETYSIDVAGNDTYHVIEIIRFLDDGGNQTPLTLTINELADGDYNYTERDEAGTFTRNTGQNAFTLVVPNSTTAGSNAVGVFDLFYSVDRPCIVGRGSEGFRGEAKWLTNGGSNTGTSDSIDITLSASSSADLQYEYAIWEAKRRSQI